MSFRTPLPTVLEAVEACPERFMVTLTSPQSLDGIRMSRLVGELLHRVNKALFGPAYARHRRMSLAVLAVQEFSYSQELHTHALIGIPVGGRECKAHKTNLTFAELVTSTWCGLDHGGLPQAQDIQQIYDLNGASRYIMKTIYSAKSLDRIDVNNCNIPLIDSAVPVSRDNP